MASPIRTDSNSQGGITTDALNHLVDSEAVMRSRFGMEGEQAGRHAIVLIVAACIVLVAAWLAYPPVGPFIALSGGMLGWLLARAWPHAAAAPAATPPLAAIVEPEDISVTIKALRHDLRGILSPAMLIADRLQTHADPAVQRAGEVVMRTVERAAARLAETKDGQSQLPVAGGELSDARRQV